MLLQKLAECADVLLHPAIGQETPIAAQHLRPEQLCDARLIGVAKEKLTRLEWRTGTGCRHFACALDDRLR